jgi:hypothetical protein
MSPMPHHGKMLGMQRQGNLAPNKNRKGETMPDMPRFGVGRCQRTVRILWGSERGSKECQLYRE